MTYVNEKRDQKVEKKHSRTSPEIQSKELNGKLRSTQPDQQQKQNHLKNKQIPLNIPISKLCSKPIFASEIGPGLNLQYLKQIQ